MADLPALQRIAETGFADIVAGTRIVDAKLRVLFTDGSYLDFVRELPFRKGGTGWRSSTSSRSPRGGRMMKLTFGWHANFNTVNCLAEPVYTSNSEAA